MRLLTSTVLASVAFMIWVCLPNAANARNPNVLFIAIDDLNDWIGCLDGHPQAKTPNIDALANRAVLFTNAHCQGPICGPSRASLLSGKYPHTTGIYQQPKGKAMENDRTHFRGHLLPEYFAKHGYKTMAVGKITHGYAGKIAFQEFGGTNGMFGPKPKERFNYFLPDVVYTGTQTDWGAFPAFDRKMPDHIAASWAVEQLNKKHDRPFFLAVGMIRPHVPFYVPGKWFNQFPLDEIQLPEVRQDDLMDVPEISRRIHAMPKYPSLQFLQNNDNQQFRKCVQAYLACTTFVDHQIGRVLKALAESPHADNTLIVLFSDHGYHIGEKNRVSKHSLWEEATHVPLIVALPDNNKSHRCDRPVGLIDIYPTLTELCGLPPKASNQGRSLVPLLSNPSAEWREGTLTTYAKGNHSVRGDRFRFIQYEDGSEELYDHQNDPNEWNNLSGVAEFAKAAQRLKRLLPTTETAYHSSTASGPVNAWFAEHLKANGVNQ